MVYEMVLDARTQARWEHRYQIEPDGTGWTLALRTVSAAEDWNAQISLLTGMAAAGIMLKAGLGLLRTMPAPRVLP